MTFSTDEVADTKHSYMSDARTFCVVTYMTNELTNNEQVLKMTQLTKTLLHRQTA